MPAVNIDEEAFKIMDEVKKLGTDKKGLVSFLIKKYAKQHINFKAERIKE